MFAFAVAI